MPVAANRVFSYRVSIDNDGRLFDQNIGYRQFLEASAHKIRNDQISHVATADISDFYSHIYHHRLEGALRTATNKTNHVLALKNLLSGWNGTESIGIPIGSAPTRLLAESTLADVDEALLAGGHDFIRFNDDYRFFVKSYAEGYRSIAFLADVLYRNHTLTLQTQKTDIFTVEDFRESFLSTPLDRELDSLHSKFQALIDRLGMADWYAPIEYEQLDDEQKAAVDALNLAELFREELQREDPEAPILRFALRRLGQLGDSEIVEDLFAQMDKLHAVLPDVCMYIRNLRHLDDQNRTRLGGRMLDLLRGSIVSELAYHRMWILDLFAHSREWDNEQRFFALYGAESDQACRRKLILAMGRAHQVHWFQSQWRSLFDQPHWARRALLAAASCMSADARRHSYRSVEPNLDVLERAVSNWARQNPF